MTTLNLCIVGHTNTGKTSLIRTLLRDDNFGEIRNQAATTRHIEAALLSFEPTQIQLYDTPGLEDASGLLDWFHTHTSPTQDGIERIQSFLNAPEAQNIYSQEAKVLRQLLNSHIAIYVIDAREPVLQQYKDELSILSWCAQPILPIFNFASNPISNEWLSLLARKSMHTWCQFDTVAFDFEGEINLWNKLATLLPFFQLTPLIHARTQEWQQLAHTAQTHIAHFLFNIAAYQLTLNHTTNPTATQAQMQNNVRICEQQLHQTLLHLYRFYQSETLATFPHSQLLTRDPFDPDLLKEYSIRTGTGIATGTLIGMGIDFITAGFSLGLGTALGSVIGGLLPNRHLISDTLTGKHTLFIDDTSLILFATRAQTLLTLLQTRGHAAQNPIHLTTNTLLWNQLPSILKSARLHPKWSSLNGYSGTNAHAARQNHIPALIASLNTPPTF